MKLLPLGIINVNIASALAYSQLYTFILLTNRFNSVTELVEVPELMVMRLFIRCANVESVKQLND